MTFVSTRRMFLGLALAASCPLVGRAQQAPRRIGMLLARRADDPEARNFVDAFKLGLGKLGWQQGRDYELVSRWLVTDVSEAELAAASLISDQVEILVVLSTPYLRAARRATTTLPIVFVATADPIGQGFVPGLARPDRNITGFAAEEPTMSGKWLELLKEAVPDLRQCMALFNPDTAPAVPQFLESLAEVGRHLSVDTNALPARSSEEIDVALAAAGKEANCGLLVFPDAFLLSRRETIIAGAARHRLPAIYYHPAFARAGGLMAYGIDRVRLFERAAHYVHLILHRTSPADLPVQMPTDFEMAINLRTAQALDLALPPSLLSRADEVIE